MTPSATPTVTATLTPTDTPTSTSTASATSTASLTPTPSGPTIDGPLESGDTIVRGTGTSNCAQILICAIGSGLERPNTPPCNGPDSVLGSGPGGANGQFTTPVPPLAAGQCIYAFDACVDLISPVACVRPPAPAPALAPRLLVVALGILALIARVGLGRARAGTAGRR